MQASRRKKKTDASSLRHVPAPLTWIEPVAETALLADRLARFRSSVLLFEVLLHQCSEPIRLDVRTMPYRILDGRHRIFLARQRGLITVPALLEVPRAACQQAIEVAITIASLTQPHKKKRTAKRG